MPKDKDRLTREPQVRPEHVDVLVWPPISCRCKLISIPVFSVNSGGAEAASELPDLEGRPLHAEQCGDTTQRRQWRAQERGHVRAPPDHDKHC